MSTLSERLRRSPRPTTEPSRSTALVVGGGIAGLVAARELALTGHDVTVLDAGELGGRVARHEVDGLVLDAGAESFATRNKSVAKLAAELGLDVVYPADAPAWLHAGEGKDIPLPRTGLVGIPGDPLEADVIAALGTEDAQRAALDLSTEVEQELLRPGISLGELVRTRLGEAALEKLVTPVVSGVHSADPDLLDADAIAPGLRKAMEAEGSLCRGAAKLRAAAPAGSAVAGLHGGMGALIPALKADLEARGVTLHSNAEVSTLEHDGALWHAAVGADVLDAERLVVATDGPTAVDLLADSVPGLAALRPQEGASVSLVTLVVDVPDLDAAPRGSGVLVAPTAADVVAKALTHATAKWPWLAQEAGPGRHVLRLSYGRMSERASTLADADDKTLIDQAVSDAAVLLGVELSAADVLGADVVRHAGALPLATAGHKALLDAVETLLDGAPELDVVGAWRAGTGLTAVVGATRAQLGLSAS